MYNLPKTGPTSLAFHLLIVIAAFLALPVTYIIARITNKTNV